MIASKKKDFELETSYFLRLSLPPLAAWGTVVEGSQDTRLDEMLLGALEAREMMCLLDPASCSAVGGGAEPRHPSYHGPRRQMTIES